jgi:type III secretory pathway component EscV
MSDVNEWFDDKFGSAPVFIGNEEKRREWDAMDPMIKRAVTQNIREYLHVMENRVAIDTMDLVIEDLVKRIEKLEGKNE